MEEDKKSEVVKRLDDHPDLVDVMIGIEDYLDRNNIYAFKNWILGELVDGPHIKPYWVIVTFKWSKDHLPDPQGAKRLLSHGTVIKYRKDYENVPQPIITPSDYEPGTHKPKIEKEQVWLVEMMIPRRFIIDIEQSVMDLYDEEVEDMDTVQDARAEGNTEENVEKGNEESFV